MTGEGHVLTTNRINHGRPQSSPEDPPAESSGPAYLAAARRDQLSAWPCHVQRRETPFLPTWRSRGFVRNTTPAVALGGGSAPGCLLEAPPGRSAGRGAEPRPCHMPWPVPSHGLLLTAATVHGNLARSHCLCPFVLHPPPDGNRSLCRSRAPVPAFPLWTGVRAVGAPLSKESVVSLTTLST